MMDKVQMTDWDKRYLDLAEQIASWSKDPSSKIGAVAVGEHGQILSQGYNGFPRGVEDTLHRWHDKKIKYDFVVHAEKNCIYNATLNGVSLKDSTMYVSGLPVCHECAKAIIQVGIKTVVFRSKLDDNKTINLKWARAWELTKQMFTEAGVTFYEYE